MTVVSRNQANMKKYRFSFAEKYAVWLNHERRCWLCGLPLRLVETTIDHVVPENLLKKSTVLAKIIEDYNLPQSFSINGFENWLPSHSYCNQSRPKDFKFLPSYQLILDKLGLHANKVARTAKRVGENVTKDKVFGKVLTSFESGHITLNDLRGLVNFIDAQDLPQEEYPSVIPDMIRLDNGYWLHKQDIAAQGFCRCYRNSCVGHSEKVYCYFSSTLSPWVIQRGLYWRCYDEIIKCCRCGDSHKRGHVGKLNTCMKPYRDQLAQSD